MQKPASTHEIKKGKYLPLSPMYDTKALEGNVIVAELYNM